MSTEYQPVLGKFQGAAGVAVSVALIFTIRTFLRTRKTEQIKVGDKFFSDLIKLRKEMDDLIKLEESEEKDFKRSGLDWRTFNTLEWNAFLINEKEITDLKLICFFKDMFLEYFKKLQESKADPESYPEWKKLRENIIRGFYD